MCAELCEASKLSEIKSGVMPMMLQGAACQSITHLKVAATFCCQALVQLTLQMFMKIYNYLYPSHFNCVGSHYTINSAKLALLMWFLLHCPMTGPEYHINHSCYLYSCTVYMSLICMMYISCTVVWFHATWEGKDSLVTSGSSMAWHLSNGSSWIP